MISSWLSGPESSGPDDVSGYPGEALGLPRTGPGSVAGLGRRIAALSVDWLLAYGLTGLGLTFGAIGESALPTAVLIVWLLLGAVAVRLFGFTPGQYACGLRVGSVDYRAQVGFGRALARGALIALVLPPLFTDADGRGLQDRATGTAVLRR